MNDELARRRRARDAYVRTLGLVGAQRARLPNDTVKALAADVVQLLSRRLAASDQALTPGPTEAEFQAFVRALLNGDPHRPADLVDEARARGMALRTIYLSYLARAARRLGELWDDDKVDFLQVTLAVGRIYAVLRSLREELPRPGGDPQRHALFMTLPGDDHLLGAAVAADLFRLRGWDIQQEAPVDQADAVACLQRSDHTLVAVAASRAQQLGDVTRLVLALRFCKPHSFILLSGHIVEEVPDLLDVVDADSQASTALEALERLEELVVNRRRHGIKT